MITDPKHPLADPDNPDSGRLIEQALIDAVAPQAPSAERARAMRTRLFQRIHAEAAGSGIVNLRVEQGDWRQLVKGVRVKMLRETPGSRSVLVEIEPGATIPTHRHYDHEECVVLRGEADLGPLHVNCGDYHVAPAGSRHGRVSSQGGALLYLRGTPIGRTAGVARDLIMAWVPGAREKPITVRADEGEWRELGPGVRGKTLWRGGAATSMLIDLAPGACLSAEAGSLDEECLVVAGEASLGGASMRMGEHQLALAGSRAREWTTLKGARLYVHGALAYAGQAA